MVSMDRTPVLWLEIRAERDGFSTLSSFVFGFAAEYHVAVTNSDVAYFDAKAGRFGDIAASTLRLMSKRRKLAFAKVMGLLIP